MITGSHHGNNNDDWQSAEKVSPAPFPRASTLRILVSAKAQNSSGEIPYRFPANQHAVVVTSAEWKSSRAPRSCTNTNFAAGKTPIRQWLLLKKPLPQVDANSLFVGLFLGKAGR